MALMCVVSENAWVSSFNVLRRQCHPNRHLMRKTLRGIRDLMVGQTHRSPASTLCTAPVAQARILWRIHGATCNEHLRQSTARENESRTCEAYKASAHPHSK